MAFLKKIPETKSEEHVKIHFFFIRTKFIRTPTLRLLEKIRTIVDFKMSLFLKGQANVSIILFLIQRSSISPSIQRKINAMDITFSQ